MVEPPLKLGSPKSFDLVTDPKEVYPATALRDTWSAMPAMWVVELTLSRGGLGKGGPSVET
jgi:hypothetical protein